MEERIIDDEYGRGIRLKKTKDGYVDVTDELTETDGVAETVEEEGDEIAFEFPNLEEDDEDLVGLSNEEALALRKKKQAEKEKRQAEYQQLCKEGEGMLAEGNYTDAEKVFEKALQLDDEAREASVGYWRAKTEDFKNPDVLAAEYVEAGIESLEFDLGYRATDDIRERYETVFRGRIQALEAEEKPLAEKVEEAQDRRRVIIKKRITNRTLVFLVCLLPFAALVALAVVFGMKNFTTSGGKFITPTIIAACAAVVTFIPFAVSCNRLINAFRMKRKNEELSATEDGERLLELRDYKDLYQCLLPDYVSDVPEMEDVKTDETEETSDEE